jgi:hypothetical protein
MELFTEDRLRGMLKEKVGKRTLTDVAAEIGISLPMMSMLIGGYSPMTGKAVAYLGFRKVRRRLYEPLNIKPKRKAG